MTIDAILLASFGGPEGPEDVVPFLQNVTAGRNIPAERLEAAGHHYYQLGGISPINEQNRELIEALRDELADRGVRLPIYWGNRNWQPSFADAIGDMQHDDRRNVLALSTSAHSSYSGCRQYRENIAAAKAEVGADDMSISLARPYGNRAGFITRTLEVLIDALRFLVENGHHELAIQILFTTHSIPAQSALTSGPEPHEAPGEYVRQHESVMEEMMRLVRISTLLNSPHRLVFQSRSGAPDTPWLEPDINDAMRALADAGSTTAVVIVPIGFISDHMEVIWDLDREALATAEELNFEYIRVPTAGIAAPFVSALADVVEDVIYGVETRTSPAGLCSGTCCPNPRAELPTIPGV
ncbi:MAG: ferrochelatase [Candidatus Nanopelagicales bacterium]